MNKIKRLAFVLVGTVGLMTMGIGVAGADIGKPKTPAPYHHCHYQPELAKRGFPLFFCHTATS